MWTSLVVTAWMGGTAARWCYRLHRRGHQSPAMNSLARAKRADPTSQAAGAELSPRIRVNAICPRVVAEALWKDHGDPLATVRSDESGPADLAKRGRVPGFGYRKLDHQRNHDHRRRSTARQHAGIQATPSAERDRAPV